MPTKMTPDDVAWEQAEEVSDKWLAQFLDNDILRPIATFIIRYNSSDATEFAILEKGGYNISLRLVYPKNAIVIRFSQPGSVLFPEEKVVNEIAVMRFIWDQTSIPVPFTLQSGTKKESPLELSPFITMDYIEHERNMYAALNTPGCPREERGVLDPNIEQDRLEKLYGTMADILLQLSSTSFSRIGSLNQIDDFTWEITRRPLPMNMNELVRLGTFPRSKLPDPDATFNTSSSYFESLADLNIEHLVHQRNDSVQSADDCRRKFVGRQLFRKLARDKRLTNPLLENGPFKLWCDDLRPANVLLGENMQLCGVVDWEFSYAAPVEFSHAPPWWLLLEKPENWSKGLDDWTRVFDYRLKTFLKVMKECEDEEIQQGRSREDRRLTGHMRESWETGDFWIVYAAMNSFAFDAIYWYKIDPRFFGTSENPEEAWKERLNLLDETERDEMERLVTRKLEEMDTRVLAWDPDEYTADFLQQLNSQEQQTNGEKVQEGHSESEGDV